jgi:hypothetical protein
MDIQHIFKRRLMLPPAIVYFDHLYSEYLALKSTPPDGNTTPIDEKTAALLEGINSKRNDLTLSWNDIYLFELAMTTFLPVERLRSRIMVLRYDYRSVAGQHEFDDYMASKPPDLMNPPDPTHPPDPTKVSYDALLREDLKDLLGRIYLRYAILPVRETRLKGLTWWAAGICGVFLLILLSFVAYFYARSGEDKISSFPIFVVAVAGAMGGFVSALQRIQAPSGEGDSIYNLSLLYNGSYAVFVAPITGATFAILLYFMFTGHVLQGRFFPEIYTPPQITASPSPPPKLATPPAVSGSPAPSASSTPAQSDLAQLSITPTPSQTPTPTPSASPTSRVSPISSPSSSPLATATAKASPSPSPSVSPSPNVTPTPLPTESTGIKEFLSESGPAGGENYALLIIWCFIAGFAERFVPDALDRLIVGKTGNAGPQS